MLPKPVLCSFLKSFNTLSEQTYISIPDTFCTNLFTQISVSIGRFDRLEKKIIDVTNDKTLDMLLQQPTELPKKVNSSIFSLYIEV